VSLTPHELEPGGDSTQADSHLSLEKRGQKNTQSTTPIIPKNANHSVGHTKRLRDFRFLDSRCPEKETV